MENSNLDLLWQWAIVFAGLLFLIYAAFVISQEKTTYQQDANKIDFFCFQFPIPKWWTQIVSEESIIQFKRTDTNYDWYAKYQYCEKDIEQLEEELTKYLDQEEIYFDEDQTTFETNPSHFILDKIAIEQVESCVRIEGTATQKTNERIYLDIIFMKIKKLNGFFIFQSHASVLNGAVEGPYFEESINQLKFKD